MTLTLSFLCFYYPCPCVEEEQHTVTDDEHRSSTDQETSSMIEQESTTEHDD